MVKHRGGVCARGGEDGGTFVKKFAGACGGASEASPQGDGGGGVAVVT